jgi:anhydro-N-acetylmuramic acid kinase
VADICQGGQGAPLVPGAEYLLFPKYQAFLNLGGIANISFKNDKGDIVAFDVCFCNILLNRLADKLGQKFDEGGEIARSGELNLSILKKLENWDFIKLNYPKSLDKDTILKEFDWILNEENIEVADLLCTLCRFIADSISLAAEPCVGNILTTGGGAFNTFLIELMNDPSRLNGRVEIADKLMIEAKEALVFALLGLLRWEGKTNTLKTVTGAKNDSVGGVIAWY